MMIGYNYLEVNYKVNRLQKAVKYLKRVQISSV